jgi:DNA-binding NarL/FixJ family response regulator
MRIKIAITEDNDSLANSIKEKLELFSEDILFKFRACNGRDLLDKLDKDNSVDVVLMDIEMPVMNGIEAAGIINERYPEIKVIMLTVFDDDEKIFQSIQNGAMGYLLKDELPYKIVESIQTIMAGGGAMSPVIAAKSLALLRNAGIPDLIVEKKDFCLSNREIEVLEKLSNGENYNQIADVLFVSPSTVRKHIENIYRKLQVHNKIQAVKLAKENKII